LIWSGETVSSSAVMSCSGAEGEHLADVVGAGHAADHLVAWHDREFLAPGADRVEVGVADAAEEDVEGDVVGPWLALLEVERSDRRVALQRGIAVDGMGGSRGCGATEGVALMGRFS
jgi:hypothetical protein